MQRGHDALAVGIHFGHHHQRARFGRRVEHRHRLVQVLDQRGHHPLGDFRVQVAAGELELGQGARRHHDRHVRGAQLHQHVRGAFGHLDGAVLGQLAVQEGADGAGEGHGVGEGAAGALREHRLGLGVRLGRLARPAAVADVARGGDQVLAQLGVGEAQVDA